LGWILKEHRENRNKVDPPKFSEAVKWFEQELEHDATLKESRLKCEDIYQRR
jgi:hypothetical protein